jgi:hypothetical protein
MYKNHHLQEGETRTGAANTTIGGKCTMAELNLVAVLETFHNLIEADLIHEVRTLLDVGLGHADVHLGERDGAV